MLISGCLSSAAALVAISSARNIIFAIDFIYLPYIFCSMLNYKTKIYTVHKKAGKDLPVVVPEGFSLWAFIFPFNIFWAFSRQCWLFLALVVATEAATAVLSDHIVMAAYLAAIRIPIYIGLGAFANDFYRASLERKGYKLASIVAANTELDAIRACSC